MKAAVLTELNKDLVIRDDVELGAVGPRDVRVKIASSGVCHSDVSVQNGTIPSMTPVVLGHEGAGIVWGCRFDRRCRRPRHSLVHSRV